MKSDSAAAPGRKPYQKPEFRSVSLRAEEVLARGCKLATGGPPPRALGCRRGGCFQAGS